jgi:hypothetical protein
MKRLLSFLPAVFAGSFLVAQEAVLTFEKHAYSAGVVNEMVLTKYVDPGKEGRNQVWDLSSMDSDEDFTGTITSSYETDIENRFPESNVVLKEFGNRFYFKLNERELKGYGMSYGNGRTIHKYDRPYVKMRFPFGYGDHISENYSGIVRISDREHKVDGTYEVLADGYGKLLLPDGSAHYPVLRVKTVQNYTLHFEKPQSYRVVTYRWYSGSERYPLAVLITSHIAVSGNTSVSHLAAYKDVSMLTGEHSPVGDQSAADLKVYPNPVEKNFTLEYHVADDPGVLIELYDHTGRKVAILVDETNPPGTYLREFNAADLELTGGTYVVRSRIGGKTSTGTLVRL